MQKVLCLLTCVALAAMAQPAPRDASGWRAHWIAAPNSSPSDFGVYHFRKAFTVSPKPAKFLVHVTADQRYQLFVNGKQVSEGPARGDLNHWRYETVDLAPYLVDGRNVLAAQVWNFSTAAPIAQWTHRTGFLLEGEGDAGKIVDTNREWRTWINRSISMVPVNWGDMYGYWAAGPMEQVRGEAYPWGWQDPGLNDTVWPPAQEIVRAAGRDSRDAHSRWMLVGSTIPPMELRPIRLQRTRLAEGVPVPAGFPKQEGVTLSVPPNTKATLLLDQDELVTGYPQLTVSQGKGASVKLRYAESLYLAGKKEKGHRDEVAGKDFVGPGDTFLLEGGTSRQYRPLWWRTWRYMRVEVQTADQPLTIHSIDGTYRAYPFTAQAKLDAPIPDAQKILDTGFRTARLCAHETYMDCPYYEQLQYAGDTRIQALVSVYYTGDARLMRNAIEQLDSSRTSEGSTLSRAPSALQQYIPGFSLWWIGMVHDYWRYQDDPAFVKQMLPGVRSVLGWWAQRQKQNALLAKLPWWNYVDWTKEWNGGVPPTQPDGNVAASDLQLLLAYQWAAELEDAQGHKMYAEEYRSQATRLAGAIRSTYWDATRGLFADTPQKKDFSQQVNMMAILAGLVKGAEAKAVFEKALTDATLVQSSIYFQAYNHEAARVAGLGDRYLSLLGEWRDQLKRGLTTWAESYEPSRSDCHAWGSSPNIELFRTVLGIDSAGAGWKRVVIRPSLADLPSAAGSVPHPAGSIAVRYTRSGKALTAEVTLPPGTTGEMQWQGASKPLQAGRNQVVFP